MGGKFVRHVSVMMVQSARKKTTPVLSELIQKWIVNYSTLRPLSHRNKIGDKFGDPTTVTVLH